MSDDQIGFVQKAKWGEWTAVCIERGCEWSHSRGNTTREQAEGHMRSHADMVHPPCIPVYRLVPPPSPAPTLSTVRVSR